MAKSNNYVSAPGRVSFPSVFESQSYEGDDAKFSITLVYTKDKMNEAELEKLQEMARLANEVSKARFGCNIGEIPPSGGQVVRSPFRKGEEKPKYYQPGDLFVKFVSKLRPGVVDQGRTVIDPTSRDFYAGCWARVSYTVYAYERKGNRGVSFGLTNVQKVRDDEPLSGGNTAPEDDFDDISGPGSNAVQDALTEDTSVDLF